jgi:hypothetical protein
MSLYPYLYPYGGYPYGGYPYGGYPYTGYPYSGLYNNFKTDSLLNEYDELNKLAVQNHDIYLQNIIYQSNYISIKRNFILNIINNNQYLLLFFVNAIAASNIYTQNHLTQTTENKDNVWGHQALFPDQN